MDNSLLHLLQQRLAILTPTQFEIIDDSAAHRGHRGNQSGGSHLELHIASEQFQGLNTLACHRLVLQQVTDLIPYPIHALSIKIIR